MGRKGELQNIYPPEVKLEAIRLHLEEGVPHQLIMLKLGISNRTILQNWVDRIIKCHKGRAKSVTVSRMYRRKTCKFAIINP